MRDDVKQGARPPHGRIVKLIYRSEMDAEGSYGFIVTADGQEIYFHENAVANGAFDELQHGTAVRYRLSDDGIEGPQASFVEAVGETR
jgi:cold shock CspA family protein